VFCGWVSLSKKTIMMKNTYVWDNPRADPHQRIADDSYNDRTTTSHLRDIRHRKEHCCYCLEVRGSLSRIELQHSDMVVPKILWLLLVICLREKYSILENVPQEAETRLENAI
jgi:hypothetical protein